MNVVLIGIRGSGKTTVARVLGEMLGREVIGLDSKIVEKAGCSITEVVNRFGWPHFRALEADVVKEVSELDGVIIDTGGGVVLDPVNVAMLKRNGISFWLTTSLPTLTDRVEKGIDRPPLLQGKSLAEEMEEILVRRTPLYRSMADYTIDTTALSIEQCVRTICDYIRERRIPPFDKILTKKGTF